LKGDKIANFYKNWD